MLTLCYSPAPKHMDVHKEGPDEHTDESAFTLLICKMRRLGSSDETVPPRCDFYEGELRAYTRSATQPCILEMGGKKGPGLVWRTAVGLVTG